MSIEISVGSGQIMVSGVGSEEKKGVGIYYKPNHGQETGSPIPSELLKDVAPDVVIWFENMAGARLFQDVVSGAVMRMNGYVVENKVKGES